MTISKAELVAAIVNGAACSKGVAEKAYDALVGTVAHGIASDGEVDLRGLGKFTREKTDARQGRNPRTGEPVDIPAGYRVKFKAGKSLRDRMPEA